MAGLITEKRTVIFTGLLQFGLTVSVRAGSLLLLLVIAPQNYDNESLRSRLPAVGLIPPNLDRLQLETVLTIIRRARMTLCAQVSPAIIVWVVWCIAMILHAIGSLSTANVTAITMFFVPVRAIFAACSTHHMYLPTPTSLTLPVCCI
jgi:hypothetical protein